MSLDKKEEINDNDVSSSNIFEDFDTNQNLMDEVEKLKTEYNKDMFYYLSLFWKIIQTIFWLLLLFYIVLYSYIYVQNNKDFWDKQFLEPFCYILNWTDKEIPWSSSCGSAKASNLLLSGSVFALKNEQFESIKTILPIAIEQDNFLKTKEISFLLYKSTNRLKILEVLEEFNNLKNEFTSTSWKSKLVCSNLSIDSNSEEISMSCNSYYNWFDKWIIWFNWDSSEIKESGVYGTSMSYANSFLNYIEKKSDNFTLINRQKIFTVSQMPPDNFWYTNVTNFTITLKINF